MAFDKSGNLGCWVQQTDGAIARHWSVDTIQLKDLKLDESVELAARDNPRQIEGASLRALRALLDAKDSQHHWGGLKKVLTPEGHYLWLCEHHAAQYKS